MFSMPNLSFQLSSGGHTSCQDCQVPSSTLDKLDFPPCGAAPLSEATMAAVTVINEENCQLRGSGTQGCVLLKGPVG